MLFLDMKFVYIIRNYEVSGILQNVIGEVAMYNPEEECKAMIDTLKRMCKQRNITPHALAKEAGISTSTISYLMNGRTKPQVYTILLLCNVLGISISQLFEDKDTNRNVELSGIEMKHLTCEEEKILIAYHCLSDKKKQLLGIYINMLLQYDDKVSTDLEK